MSNNETVVEAMSHLLADSYTLYLKTHSYRWNVTGPMFTTLHTLFETQYNDLALAVDETAERIRSLGARAPRSYTEFDRLDTVKEATGEPSAKDMIADLVADHASVVTSAQRVVEAADGATISRAPISARAESTFTRRTRGCFAVTWSSGDWARSILPLRPGWSGGERRSRGPAALCA
jgi:starvation-inducible DNA-binding protein